MERFGGTGGLVILAVYCTSKFHFACVGAQKAEGLSGVAVILSGICGWVCLCRLSEAGALGGSSGRDNILEPCLKQTLSPSDEGESRLAWLYIRSSKPSEKRTKQNPEHLRFMIQVSRLWPGSYPVINNIGPKLFREAIPV